MNDEVIPNIADLKLLYMTQLSNRLALRISALIDSHNSRKYFAESTVPPFNYAILARQLDVRVARARRMVDEAAVGFLTAYDCDKLLRASNLTIQDLISESEVLDSASLLTTAERSSHVMERMNRVEDILAVLLNLDAPRPDMIKSIEREAGNMLIQLDIIYRLLGSHKAEGQGEVLIEDLQLLKEGRKRRGSTKTNQ